VPETCLQFTIGLAANVNKCQAPFTSIAEKQYDFIDRKYIPSRITLKDPRSMRQDHIIKFFEHIVQRQSSHGIEDTFKFKAVLTRRKKGDLTATKYPEQARNQALTTIDEQPAPGIDTYMSTFQTGDLTATKYPEQARNQALTTIDEQPAPGIDTHMSTFQRGDLTATKYPEQARNPALTTIDEQPAPGIDTYMSTLQLDSPTATQSGNQNPIQPAPIQPDPRPNTTQPARPKARPKRNRNIVPAPATAKESSRPKPRPTGKAKLQQAQPEISSEPDYLPESAPVGGLTLTDHDYQGDYQVDLDPILDPLFMNHPATTPRQEASGSSLNLTNYLESTPTQASRTPRRNSDMMALEEAQRFTTNRRRH
jgi:hypothetical protein